MFVTSRLKSAIEQAIALNNLSPGNTDHLLSFIHHEIQRIYNTHKENMLDDKASAYKTVMQAIDEAWDKHDKKNVACGNCSFCCHINVDVTDIEAKILVDYCREKGIEIDKEYIAEQAKLPDVTYSSVSKCVFLKEGRCSVYEVRPLACRHYHVAFTNEYCDTVNHKQEKVAVEIDWTAEMVLSAIGMDNLPTGSLPEMLLKEL